MDDIDKWESASRLIKRLPPEKQTEIYEIAQMLNISPGGADDLLYHIMLGLGYHKSMICGVPDNIVKSGMAVDQQINKTLRNFEAVIDSRLNKWHQGRTAIVSGGLVVLLIGVVAGWFVKTAFPPELNNYYLSAGHVFSQLTCISVDKFWKCTDKNKNSVYVVAPGGRQ